MKEKVGFIFGGMILVSILFACSNHTKRTTLDECPVVAHTDDNGIDVCDIAAVKDTMDFPLSKLFSDFEVILLENSDNALAGDESRVWASEKHIGIYSSQTAAYKLFDKSGRFLGDITKRGQGPNEFLFGIYDSYIDETEGKIYILSMMANKIMVFDLLGNPLQPIPMPFEVHKGRFTINTKEKTLVLMVLPFSDTPSVVWKQDFDGNILQEIPAEQFVIDPGDYSNEVYGPSIQSTLTYYLFRWIPEVDSLYHYDESNNKLSPVFTAHFNNDVIMHDYRELPGYYVAGLITPVSYSTILIDRNTLKGSYVRWELDMLGGISGGGWFHQGYYTACIHPVVLKEQLEAALIHPENMTEEISHKVMALNNSITDDDNDIVLIGTLK